MSSATITTMVVPTGHCLGPHHPSGGGAAEGFWVRVGPEQFVLDPTQFVLWGLAHGAPDRDPDRPWTGADLLRAAQQVGCPAPERTFAWLAERSLVLEVAVEGPGAVDFARRFRLVPLMLGLGNTPEDPGAFGVGVIGQPLVWLSGSAYDLYQWAHLEDDLWAGCRAAAATATAAGLTDPAETDPQQLLENLLGSLHSLLAPNALYVDTGRLA